MQIYLNFLIKFFFRKKRLGRPPKIKKIEPKSLDETLISDSELDLHSPEASHDGVDHSTTRDEDMNLDEDFEIHPQHSILASTDTSRQFIKRPLNAYMIWTRHARDGILKSNPHLKMNEVSKTVSICAIYFVCYLGVDFILLLNSYSELKFMKFCYL